MALGRLSLILAGAAAAVLTGCREEIVPEPYWPSNAHDAYRHGLEQAGLRDTALGRDWARAAVQALDQPTLVDTPLRETLYIDPASALAVGYRFSVLYGQRIEIVVERQGWAEGRLFLDLFRITEDEPPRHVASAPDSETRLEFEPRRDGGYLLRLQSELLRGGQVTITIANRAAMAFPVQGHSPGDVQSGFGAPREGGRRSHHGVDIFAPRHTPVLAPAKAYVSFVGDRGLGGRVVWLTDPERGLSLYFAHLQTQEVERGDSVAPGDRIGTIGNSGNARTTPPHLHFGIYVRGRGPVDPIHFIRQPAGKLQPIRGHTGNIGQWVRSMREGADVLVSPDKDSQALQRLPIHTPVRVRGAVSEFYRVQLPDGVEGFLASSALESVFEPIDLQVAEADLPLLDRPATEASARANLPSGQELQILGQFQSYRWVRSADGLTGWVARR